MCDIVFEKTKGHGATVNRTRVFMQKHKSEGFQKKVLREISHNLQEKLCAGISFSIKLLAPQICNFIKNKSLAQKFVRTPFL